MYPFFSKEKLPSILEHGTTKARLISEGVDLGGFICTTNQWERIRLRSYDDPKLVKTCSTRLQQKKTDGADHE
eukprot:10231652-Prorocentrum_lima.AAC.1